MSIKATHPLYNDSIDDVVLMRDSYLGSARIKSKGLAYLPATPGMRIDGMSPGQPGLQTYESYKQRAVYPEFVSDAVEALIGMMHSKEATFELPDGMLDMLDRATIAGESMQGLLRRINEQQLVTGRLGLLLDLPAGVTATSGALPYIALYNGEAIRNWDESDDNTNMNRLNLLVLDESGYERKEGSFNWETVERYRVLELKDGKYQFGTFKGSAASYNESEMEPPLYRGAPLKEIPFTFINTKDNAGKPDNPPLLPLARAALSVYQGEADYRQALFLQGQDTLVVIGGTRNADGSAETRVGAGAKIDVDMGGDAKYIGVSSTGLPELRMALENDYKRAEAKTGKLVDAMGSKQESGEALQTRLRAQTATLNQIAKTGAAGLEQVLKIAARWMGLDESKVKVTPNLDFADVSMTGKELLELVTAKNMGAPLSNESIHNLMRLRRLTTKTLDEELATIQDEEPLIPPAPANSGTGSTGNNE